MAFRSFRVHIDRTCAVLLDKFSFRTHVVLCNRTAYTVFMKETRMIVRGSHKLRSAYHLYKTFSAKARTTWEFLIALNESGCVEGSGREATVNATRVILLGRHCSIEIYRLVCFGLGGPNAFSSPEFELGAVSRVMSELKCTDGSWVCRTFCFSPR